MKAPLPGLSHREIIRQMAMAVNRLGGQAAAAREWRVTPQFLSLVLKSKRQVGPRLARAMGFRATRYLIYRYEAIDGPPAR